MRRIGARLRFRWHKGAFVRDEDLPPDHFKQMRATAEVAAENEAYMRCLAAAALVQQAVSHHPGTNYAPTIFSKMTEGSPFTRVASQPHFRLLHLGRIALDQQLWKGRKCVAARPFPPIPAIRRKSAFDPKLPLAKRPISTHRGH